MKINQFKLNHYNAILNSFCYSTGAVESYLYTKGMNHLNMSTNITPQSRELVLTFERAIDISDLTSELLKGAIIDQEDGFLYDVLLSSTPSIIHIGCEIYEVSYPLSVIVKGKLVKVNVASLTNKIMIIGNHQAYPIITIKPKKDIATFSVLGITIKSLKTGKKVVIDSVNKLIEQDDVNKFKDTDLKKWPTLNPGIHTIEKSSLDADVYIEYHPVYM